MILWLEDDHDWVDTYKNEIENVSSDEVLITMNPDDFFKTFNKFYLLKKIKLAIIDIQMATGESISRKLANGGTKTGEIVIEKLRLEHKTNFPIIIWSIKDDWNLEELARIHGCFYYKKTESYEQVLSKIGEIYET